jgi:hypothetical protein
MFIALGGGLSRKGQKDKAKHDQALDEKPEGEADETSNGRKGIHKAEVFADRREKLGSCR